MMRFKPDLVILGGFMKWHVLILIFAKLIGAKVAIMSEPLRKVSSDDEGSSLLLTYENSRRKIKLIRRLFLSADLFIGMGEVARVQFIEQLGFPEKSN